MNLKQIIIGLSGVFLLGACQGSPMFMEYKSVDANGWCSSSPVVFKLPDVDDTVRYDAKVSVRAIQSYKYDNLVLIIKLKEGKKTVSSDTVSYTMLDENGENIGTGFPYVEQDVSLAHKYKLMPKKKYRVVVTHAMRLDPLDGVSDIGITIASSDFAQHPFSGK